MRSQRPDRPAGRGLLGPALHRTRAGSRQRPQPGPEHHSQPEQDHDPGRQLRHERVIRELVDATTELLAELAESYPQLAAARLQVVSAAEPAGPDRSSRPLADVIQLPRRTQP